MAELYKPRMEDLWFREKMLSDGQTMAYNRACGGTIPFPKERWADWYGQWITYHENKRWYRYVLENGTYVGEVAYHFEEERQIWLANVIVYAPYRRKGYGRKALLLLCQAAEKHGIRELYDDIALDNPSVLLFLKCGFTEILRTDTYILVKKELGV